MPSLGSSRYISCATLFASKTHSVRQYFFFRILQVSGVTDSIQIINPVLFLPVYFTGYTTKLLWFARLNFCTNRHLTKRDNCFWFIETLQTALRIGGIVK